MKGIVATTVLLVLVGSETAQAQNPDVRFLVDTNISYRTVRRGSQTIKFYSPLGRFSTASLTFRLEPGLRVFVSQRLQRIKGDADDELFDEYYVEDEGLWRLGKQVLPFGSGRLIREAVMGARGDTNLVVEGIPVTLVGFDGGNDKSSGFMARLGSRVKFTAALGQHIGESASSLALVRSPEDSAGPDSGFKRVFGIAGEQSFGKWRIDGEAVDLQNPESPKETAGIVTDALIEYRPHPRETWGLGRSEYATRGIQVYRIQASIPTINRSAIEPMIRFKDNRLYDVSVSLRIKF